jgi:limonene-1,2-epoxide hydrolase
MTQRRNLLAASATGLMAMLATRAQAQQNSTREVLTNEEKANILLVDRFCQAWEAMDLAQVTATMKTDAIYRQSQNAPPVTGHQGVYDLMQPWIESSNRITYEVLETFARGPVVIKATLTKYDGRAARLCGIYARRSVQGIAELFANWPTQQKHRKAAARMGLAALARSLCCSSRLIAMAYGLRTAPCDHHQSDSNSSRHTWSA